MSGQTVPTQPPPSRPARSFWVLVASALVTVGFFVVSLLVPGFIDSAANTASVWGLWVTVVGFRLTLWTVLETRRIARAAQEETRATVGRIALQTLEGHCEAISRLLTDELKAVEDREWARAIERFQEIKRLAVRAQQFSQLQPGEQEAFRTGAEKMRSAVTHIRMKILPDELQAALPEAKQKSMNKHRAAIEQFHSQVDSSAARLHHLVWEIHHAN